MNPAIENLLKFMQREDSNGTWLEWLEEIRNKESEFDRDYVIEVLKKWHEDSGDEIYLKRIEEIKNEMEDRK